MSALKLGVVTAAAVLMLAGCGKGDVADVSLGIFTLKDIAVNAFVDPEVPGVTCHVASIESPLSLTDPSESAVSCRQTGEITPTMIERIKTSGSDGDVIFSKSKSVFLKRLKIRRIFDAKNQTIIYISYATKETTGSFEHSISTIPLWGTAAYVKPVSAAGESGGAQSRF